MTGSDRAIFGSIGTIYPLIDLYYTENLQVSARASHIRHTLRAFTLYSLPSGPNKLKPRLEQISAISRTLLTNQHYYLSSRFPPVQAISGIQSMHRPW